MSGTLTVKELIKGLLEFDMDEPVFIGLGDNSLKPSGSSEILHLSQFGWSGVYLCPALNLIEEIK